MIYKIYDTCSLLKKADHLFEDDKSVMVISSVTFQELESIKTSAHKDAEIKASARKITRELELNEDNYETVIFSPKYIENNELLSQFELTNDIKIISCGLILQETYPNDEVIFVTNDLCCKHIAELFFNKVEKVEDNPYEYEGYEEVYLNSDEMAQFYSNMNMNTFNLYINEYLIIHDKETEEVVDKVCWDGETHRHITYENFSSQHFGDVKPFKDDPYQALVTDSFAHNKITMVKGPAGSGKTYLSLGYLIHKLERNRIDKIIIFCNTVATKNSAKLGYYPGTRDEKLLDSQIGNLLISKFGGRDEVERLIEEEKLVLLPLSDIRGYDTSGMRAGIYISEAQNLDVSLMKLTLQRIGEDSVCIIDGDCKTQVDDISFAGANNGMRRASQIFRGHDIYGEITLKTIHRSHIAQIAEEM